MAVPNLDKQLTLEQLRRQRANELAEWSNCLPMLSATFLFNSRSNQSNGLYKEASSAAETDGELFPMRSSHLRSLLLSLHLLPATILFSPLLVSFLSVYSTSLSSTFPSCYLYLFTIFHQFASTFCSSSYFFLLLFLLFSLLLIVLFCFSLFLPLIRLPPILLFYPFSSLSTPPSIRTPPLLSSSSPFHSSCRNCGKPNFRAFGLGVYRRNPQPTGPLQTNDVESKSISRLSVSSGYRGGRS